MLKGCMALANAACVCSPLLYMTCATTSVQHILTHVKAVVVVVTECSSDTTHKKLGESFWTPNALLVGDMIASNISNKFSKRLERCSNYLPREYTIKYSLFNASCVQCCVLEHRRTQTNTHTHTHTHKHQPTHTALEDVNCEVEMAQMTC